MKCYLRCAFYFSLAAWMKTPLLFKVIALWEYDNNSEDVQCEDKMQTNVPFKKTQTERWMVPAFKSTGCRGSKYNVNKLK